MTSIKKLGRSEIQVAEFAESIEREFARVFRYRQTVNVEPDPISQTLASAPSDAAVHG
jgi:hypothetical protein